MILEKNGASGHLKKASSSTDALTNATEYILIVGKGITTGTTRVALSILIPKASLDSESCYWSVSDAYAGGTDIHLQANVETGKINNVGLFYGSSRVSSEVIEYYYV